MQYFVAPSILLCYYIIVLAVNNLKMNGGVFVIMKKLKIIVAIAMSLIVFDVAMANTANPSIYVNGNKIAAEAVVVNNQTYIPLSAVSESLGAKVSFDQGSNKIEITSPVSYDEIVPNIIKKVSPSVVGIIGNYNSNNDKYSDVTSHGTGVIIKSGGEILTNAHVVKDLKNIIVVLNDGSAYNGKLKNIDEKSDLAIVKIDKVGLPIATFASMDSVVTGKSVIAIGTPVSFSLMNSASMGIISGINRGIISDYALIQTDAAINPGNSGGPLVNMAGEVVGINSNKFVGTSIEGMCFSIPVDTVSYVLSHFEKYGAVVRPNLGAEFEESWAARMGLPTKSGLTIKKVLPGSNASKAGIQNGDIILSIDGVNVNSKVDLNECMKKYMPGDTCKFVINRNGTQISINVTY